MFNALSEFKITENYKTEPARLIFVTEDGTIAGWNPLVNETQAIIKVDRSSTGAVYKGVALGSIGQGQFLFATNFRQNAVEAFDNNFNFIGSFTDTSLPAGYAPFGIANVSGLLVITFAKQLPPDNEDDDPGPGRGFVDIFTTTGQFIGRIVDNHSLNSPWGIAVAPANFGKFNNALLIGNFGDGRINAFNISTGEFLGQLNDRRGNVLEINGLWSLLFATKDCQPTNALYFAAGIADEDHGLFGKITPTKEHKY